MLLQCPIYNQGVHTNNQGGPSLLNSSSAAASAASAAAIPASASEPPPPPPCVSLAQTTETSGRCQGSLKPKLCARWPKQKTPRGGKILCNFSSKSRQT